MLVTAGEPRRIAVRIEYAAGEVAVSKSSMKSPSIAPLIGTVQTAKESSASDVAASTFGSGACADRHADDDARGEQRRRGGQPAKHLRIP